MVYIEIRRTVQPQEYKKDKEAVVGVEITRPRFNTMSIWRLQRP